MLEDNPGSVAPAEESAPAEKAAAKKTAAKKSAAKKAPAKKAPAKKAAKKVAVPDPEAPAAPAAPGEDATPAKKTAAKKAAARKAPAKKTAATEADGSTASGTAPLFQAPDTTARPAKKAAAKKAPAKKAAAGKTAESTAESTASTKDESRTDHAQDDDQSGEGGEGAARRRRRRGGRRRRKPGDSGGHDGNGQDDNSRDDHGRDGAQGSDDESSEDQGDRSDQADGEGESSSSRRRRRRRRAGEEGDAPGDDPDNTVTRVRQGRSPEDQITALSGSTRLEAKKQRRREGREAGRRRAPIVSEAEFLARRESVDRVMAIRQRDELTQIAVLEDKVLVEHYVARESQNSLIGNVYLGRVQNVLPSMEAAFIDIGKGRNAVLYAGEVNWSALGHKDGQPRKIESVLSSGQSILVQVTKDPMGHKGARLTSQVSLAGRFLVYVPDGTTSGISRKLPDTERNRLKTLLKEIVPDTAGVIVRTAAEGASEDELTRDVERLKARWEDIEKKTKGNAPQLLYGEPDLTLKVVRDLFTEDFSRLVIDGDEAWDTVSDYVAHVAPDLQERMERYDAGESGRDVFASFRIDEQIHKGLDRKVWLPSGGSLVIDRTEAMTVVDVNTGKFTGSGGNLEETVTKNNLEAAEEIVRQLRLRDIGGIIVVDFIDMVLESNRDLVLRRLVECLGRDRTRHQVAEVTSLGLVQMTRKRIGTGLLEAFSENCEHCGGRGLVIADAPVEPRKGDDERRSPRRSRRGKGEDQQDEAKQDQGKPDQGKQDQGRGRGKSQGESQRKSQGTGNGNGKPPSPKDVAAMARHEDEQAPEPAESNEPTPESAPEPAPESAPESRPAPEPEASEPVAEPAAEPAEEPAAVPAKEPEAPKVVTRTRRRSASRPAGPPVATEAPEALNVGVVGTPAQSGTAEPGTADAEPAAPPVVEHVPIKKRGARKR